MTTVLVTGSGGFVGKNLVTALRRREGLDVRTYDVEDDQETLERHLREAHVVFHLAGVNRPQKEDEFVSGNAELTRTITRYLKEVGRTPLVVMSSTIQAELDNPYGRSKLAAEQALLDYRRSTGGKIAIYRLPNVFGKWSRPNYNTVVATYCHNVARGLDISVNDPSKELELVYVDDVVDELLGLLADGASHEDPHRSVGRTFRVTLGALAEKVRQLKEMRTRLLVPDLTDAFMTRLHATYLSFLEPDDFAYAPDMRTDNRGMLFELVKSASFGQIFVSTTHPGVTRGNHYHDTKVEKFCLVKGRAAIRFRHLATDHTVEYLVSEDKIQVVDIPPGYTHHIENISDSEMVVIFWSSQIFDPKKPDTYSAPVQKTND